GTGRSRVLPYAAACRAPSITSLRCALAADNGGLPLGATDHPGPLTPRDVKHCGCWGCGQPGKTPQWTVIGKRARSPLPNLVPGFLQEHVPQHCKPRTAYEYRRAVQLFIEPALGCHRVSDLLRADVAQFHHDLRDRPYQANRALGVLSKMMNLAEAWGLRLGGSNPVRHVKKYREDKRERYLTKAELQRLGAVLADAETKAVENPFAIAAIGLLVLTGARLTEILTLRWEHVDLENEVLRLPDSKTGAKLIYLNAAAINLLRTMP